MATLKEICAAWTIRSVARVLTLRQLDVNTSGVEHVPRHGAVVFAARHFHHLYDGSALLRAVPRRIHILVSLDWAQGQNLRRVMEWATWAARWPMFLRPDALTPGPDGIPPQRASAFSVTDVPRYQRRALRDSVELLAQGSALLVFPEGYPNIDPHYTPKTAPDEMLPFRSGFSALASIAQRRLGKRIPIVPTGLSYTPGVRWNVHVRFGKPVFVAAPDSRHGFVRAIERQVAELSDLPVTMFPSPAPKL
jgi:putative membrane protein